MVEFDLMLSLIHFFQEENFKLEPKSTPKQSFILNSGL